MRKLVNWFRLYATGIVVEPADTKVIDVAELEAKFAAEEGEEWGNEP